VTYRVSTPKSSFCIALRLNNKYYHLKYVGSYLKQYLNYGHHHHHHHHMTLQPNSGPGLPLWGFVTITFYRAGLLVQHPTPNLEEQASVFMTPGDRVAQLYTQELGTHFSRLLQHAWVTVRLLFFNPGHHTRPSIMVQYNKKIATINYEITKFCFSLSIPKKCFLSFACS
jgi:hypothetical protein